VHQLVNKGFDNIKMHGTTAKKRKRCFNLLLVSLDPIISSLRKLSKNITETYLLETLNLFAVPKELEDLNISDATATEGGSNDTSEEIDK
jgi:hypothetical protein